jgi:hypothetical protein
MMDKFDVHPITKGARETLWCLFNHGPTQAGNVPCKAGRSWLINKGYCEGEDGWYWLTSDGVTLALEIGFGKLKERSR